MVVPLRVRAAAATLATLGYVSPLDEHRVGIEWPIHGAVPGADVPAAWLADADRLYIWPGDCQGGEIRVQDGRGLEWAAADGCNALPAGFSPLVGYSCSVCGQVVHSRDRLPTRRGPMPAAGSEECAPVELLGDWPEPRVTRPEAPRLL